ncbi:hypothetical protein [Kibdelosporangium philippinense]|uniref:hypothetical protein n=1 Tax=Kibdelosporangium philippinense TaxID=211113 RepID=UPI00360A65F9
MSIDELVSVVAPPAQRTTGEIAWHAVESQLNSALPLDYKQLVSRYGPGYFSKFIHIYQPSNDLSAIDLVTQAGSRCGH